MTTQSKHFYGLLAFIFGMSVSVSGNAQPIAISYYDINDAVLSGHGNWHHSYNGNITNGANFNNFIPGTVATYQGGSGTLNDGVIGFSTNNSVSGGTNPNTQLFVTPSADDGTAINPVIYLTLDTAQP